MAEPFLSEIATFGFNFAPKYWSVANGDLLPISEHQALVALIGSLYGGDGRSTFALPDLRGRVPMGTGYYQWYDLTYTYDVAETGGVGNVTLLTPNLPSHTHNFNATTEIGNAAGNKLGGSQLAEAEGTSDPLYEIATNLVSLNDAAISSTGGGSAHTNVQPYQSILFCIAMEGIFPPRQ